jgi:hypothetical protein
MSPSDVLMAVLILGPWLIPAMRLMRMARRASESVSLQAAPVQTEPVRARDQIWVTPQRASWLTRNRVS